MTRNLQAKDIIQLLESPDYGNDLGRRIYKEATIKEILLALHQILNPEDRMELIAILGERGAKSAVPALIGYLSDPLPKVQIYAAEALGKIGDPRAGDALFEHFEATEHSMSATGLGGVQYRPAIPSLIRALSSDKRGLRASAAWSLGKLHAEEAEAALEQALSKETYGDARVQIKEALSLIRAKHEG